MNRRRSKSKRAALGSCDAPLQTPPGKHLPGSVILLVAAVALVIGTFLYAPAFRGPFLFDDSGLPFWGSDREEGLSEWIGGVRPALMFSYWVNRTILGDGPVAYHVVNLGIHVANSVLVYLLLWRLLAWRECGERQRKYLSALGSVIFLIHPLQTESVSYVAGRSESFSTLFVLLAYLAFLYRRNTAISWLESAGVLSLFGIALLAKENAISLLGLLILTDAYWPTPFSTAGLRRNWRLYAIVAPAGLVGCAAVLRMLANAPTAGFSIREYTWYQYGLTQARAVFTYIRLAVAPIGQSVDHDFPPSRSLMDHGAVVWLLLLGLLVVASVRLRRRAPLACFGLLFFLITLAPTSSIVPIADPLVERRMYLPLAGLILIGCEAALRMRFSSPLVWSGAAAAVLVLAVACYERNRAWSRPSDLFMDAALRSTHNARPYLNLTELAVRERRCDAAIPYLERADRLFPRDARVHIAWSWALECLDRKDEALRRLLKARNIKPSSRVYEQIGLLYGEMGRVTEAGQTLQEAVALDPHSASAHEALALWYESVRDLNRAEAEYQKSLAIDRYGQGARIGLVRVRNAQTDQSP